MQIWVPIATYLLAPTRPAKRVVDGPSFALGRVPSKNGRKYDLSAKIFSMKRKGARKGAPLSVPGPPQLHRPGPLVCHLSRRGMACLGPFSSEHQVSGIGNSRLELSYFPDRRNSATDPYWWHRETSRCSRGTKMSISLFFRCVRSALHGTVRSRRSSGIARLPTSKSGSFPPINCAFQRCSTRHIGPPFPAPALGVHALPTFHDSHLAKDSCRWPLDSKLETGSCRVVQRTPIHIRAGQTIPTILKGATH